MAGLNEHAAGTGDAAAMVEVVQSVEPDGTVVLAVTGEVDLASVDTLRAAVDEALQQEPPAIVFDLAGLRFMDSSGIAVLLYAAARTGAVQVRNPSAVVRRVLELSGLTTTLHLNP